MFRALFSLAVIVGTVSASLYPTKPNARTVYNAGRRETVTWREDKSLPRLKDLGRFNIDLYAGESLIESLAHNVDPLKRRETIFIPRCAAHDNEASDLFTMRFIGKHTTIYSADFSIANITRTGHPPAHAAVVATSTTPSTPNEEEHVEYATLVLPETTLVTRLAAASVLHASKTVYANPLPTEDGKDVDRYPNRTRRRSDLFRVMFTLWPAFVGLSMVW